MRDVRLDQLITFERETATPDGYGGQTSSYAQIAQEWAQVTGKKGDEKAQNGNLADSALINVVIRSNFDILETDSLLWDDGRGDQRYNIRSILNSGNRDAWMVIEAERGVAQ
jgi:head-tail adaptor